MSQLENRPVNPGHHPQHVQHPVQHPQPPHPHHPQHPPHPQHPQGHQMSINHAQHHYWTSHPQYAVYAAPPGSGHIHHHQPYPQHHGHYHQPGKNNGWLWGLPNILPTVPIVPVQPVPYQVPTQHVVEYVPIHQPQQQFTHHHGQIPHRDATAVQTSTTEYVDPSNY